MKKDQNPDAINYRMKEYASDKFKEKDYYHFLPADETFVRIQPVLKAIGVTRVGDITGLDRLGIPVINIIRPNLDGYAVQHGKGLTLKAAKVSAGMEAIERYYGSNISLTSFLESYDQVSKDHKVASWDKFPFANYSLFNPNLPERWVLGWDIINATETAVPYNLVSMRRIYDGWEIDSFQSTSNGLAAGMDFLEAVSQAVLEVIERDAVACHEMAAKRVGSEFPLKLVDPASIPYPEVIDLLEKVKSRQMLLLLFDSETDTGVPVFNCYILDRLNSHHMICHGMGASLNSKTAMIRAITECIQARAVYRSGMRDIFFQDQFLHHTMFNKEKYIRKFESAQPTINNTKFRNEETDNFGGDIRKCIDKLKKAGIESVIVLDLSPPDWDVFVVKVVIPGLEGYVLPNYSPGKRGKQYLTDKKI